MVCTVEKALCLESTRTANQTCVCVNKVIIYFSYLTCVTSDALPLGQRIFIIRILLEGEVGKITGQTFIEVWRCCSLLGDKNGTLQKFGVSRAICFLFLHVFDRNLFCLPRLHFF